MSVFADYLSPSYNIDFPESKYDGQIEPTEEALNQIFMEAAAELEAISLQPIYESVDVEFMSTEDLTRVFEATEGNSKIARMKEVIKRLWDKFNAWLKKTYEAIVRKFKKYGKLALMGKGTLVASEFIYEGRKITYLKGEKETSAIVERVDSAIEKVSDRFKSIDAKSLDGVNWDYDSIKKDLIKSTGFDDFDKLREHIELAYFNGEKEKRKIHGFEANSIDELVRAHNSILNTFMTTTKQLQALVNGRFSVLMSLIDNRSINLIREAPQHEAKVLKLAKELTSMVQFSNTIIHICYSESIKNMEIVMFDCRRVITELNRRVEVYNRTGKIEKGEM